MGFRAIEFRVWLGGRDSEFRFPGIGLGCKIMEFKNKRLRLINPGCEAEGVGFGL